MISTKLIATISNHRYIFSSHVTNKNIAGQSIVKILPCEIICISHLPFFSFLIGFGLSIGPHADDSGSMRNGAVNSNLTRGRTALSAIADRLRYRSTLIRDGGAII
jgi:hypothetical protein